MPLKFILPLLVYILPFWIQMYLVYYGRKQSGLVCENDSTFACLCKITETQKCRVKRNFSQYVSSLVSSLNNDIEISLLWNNENVRCLELWH